MEDQKVVVGSGWQWAAKHTRVPNPAGASRGPQWKAATSCATIRGDQRHCHRGSLYLRHGLSAVLVESSDFLRHGKPAVSAPPQVGRWANAVAVQLQVFTQRRLREARVRQRRGHGRGAGLDWGATSTW